MAIFPGSAIPSAVSDDYEIENSLRLNNADNPRLTRSLSGGNKNTFTMSFWFKWSLVASRELITAWTGTNSDANWLDMGFSADGQFRISGWNTEYVKTTQLFRDPAAWYHFVVAVDTTQGTAADRIKLYVNGEQVTALATSTYPTQNFDFEGIGGGEFVIGAAWNSGGSGSYYGWPTGYLAEFYFTDGAQYAPSDFGELDSDTNQWKPLDSDDVKDAVTFGTNGFYQKYNSTELAASFTDSASHQPHTVTAAGNTHTDTSVKKIGTASAQMDGTGDYLSIPHSTDFNFDTGDFTVEFWFRTTSLSDANQTLWSKSDADRTGIQSSLKSDGSINFAADNDASHPWVINVTSAASLVSINTWYHYALVRNGTAWNLYLDGTSIISTTATLDFDDTSAALLFGSWSFAHDDLVGYMDEIRVSKGIARYVGSFTPSTTEFTSDQYTKLLLHCDGSDSGTTFTDSADSAPRHTITANGNATNQRPQYHDVTTNGNAHLIGPKVGTSVAKFQGTTSDRLSVAASSDFNFGTGDWTVEVFANKDQDLDASIYRFGDGSPVIELIIDENDKPKWYVENTSGSSFSADGSDGDTELNRWYHLAAVKSGTTLTFYLNGVSKATATGLSGDFGNSTDTTDVGSRGSSSKPFGGYMDSLRVSNSARYTANFTPPTTSFTNDSNTKLLIQNGTDGSQTFTDGSSSSHTITVNGDVRWVAPKIGAGAMAFDGSAAYSIADSPDYDFNDGPFTVETWVKFNTVASADIVTKYDDHPTIDQRSWGIKYPDADNLEFRYSTNGSSWAAEMTFSWTPSANTWYHIAVTRDSSSDIRAFVDGTQIGSTTNVTADFYSSTALLVLGADMSYGSINTGNGLDGFMGPTRISKGVARYTANFTAPTTLFTGAINDTLIANADINHGTWNPDTSTGLAISTDSRMSFPATGDFLSLADSADWNFGTSNFTLEAWLKRDADGSYQTIMCSKTDNSNYWQWRYFGGSGNFDFTVTGTSAFSVNWTVDKFPLGTWVHHQMVRSSNSWYLFQDGVQVGSTQTNSGTVPDHTGVLAIPGNDSWLGQPFLGDMDEIRISNTARNTSNFTPKVRGEPFTADANTKLLIHSDYTGGLGADSSGNYNNFTATNLVATDQVVDSPTNSFCTLNPLDMTWSYPTGQPIGPPTLSEGNLKSTKTSGSNGYEQSRGTIAVSSGKWYYEMYLVNAGSSNHQSFGIATTSTDSLRWWGGAKSTQWTYQNDGSTFNDDTQSSGDADTYAAGDICSIAFDCDAGKIWFAKNNTWLGSGSPNPATGADARYTNLGSIIASDGNPVAPFNVLYSSSASEFFNFGADSSFAGAVTAQGNQDGNDKGDFYYTPPSGFLALCTDNLSTPEIKLPGEFHSTVLYTGNATARSITGVGHQPDFIWFKNRGQTDDHLLYDSVRGFDSGWGEALFSNKTDAQVDYSEGLSSFDSDGFSIGTYTGLNSNTYGIVAWNWKAGGAPTADNSAGAGATPTAGSVKIDGSNLGSALAGSIAATRLSANTTSGFSIVQYEGTESAATVAHGLSQAPELIIFKNIDSSLFWPVYSKPTDATDYLILNSDAAVADSDGYFNDTEPTSTVFSLGDKTNNNRDTCIAYCFHGLEGYSKIGSYTGNSNADGTFVYCGFKPAYLLMRCTNVATTGGQPSDWLIYDNKRAPSLSGPPNYNMNTENLWANRNTTEPSAQGHYVDFVSNGFKWRGTDGSTNNSSNTYIYYAVASHPFKTSNAR